MPSSNGDKTLQTISHEDYVALKKNAKVIEYDLHGEKVLKLASGNYLKLFRRKRLLSSAAWYPYAQRFADNARALKERRIACPEVEAVYRIPSIRRDAVLYRPLSGNTLRELIQTQHATPGLANLLATFVFQLHEKGVYFRSLHLGNIVYMSNNSFGLIDIADLKLKNRPLSKYHRCRNLMQLRRNPQDRAWLETKDETPITETAHSADRGDTPDKSP